MTATGRHIKRPCGMPYEMRIRMYQREKERLFMRIADMTPSEVEAAHKQLAEKWRV